MMYLATSILLSIGWPALFYLFTMLSKALQLPIRNKLAQKNNLLVVQFLAMVCVLFIAGVLFLVFFPKAVMNEKYQELIIQLVMEILVTPFFLDGHGKYSIIKLGVFLTICFFIICITQLHIDTKEYVMPSPIDAKLADNTEAAVYSGPGTSYYRSAKGKALTNFKDWIKVYAQDNGWILVEYNVGTEKQRIGYIQPADLVAASAIPDLPKANETVKIMVKGDQVCQITDEPNKGGTPMGTLYDGEEVTFLCIYNSYAYVEYLGGMTPMRGFILLTYLDLPKGKSSLGFRYASIKEPAFGRFFSVFVSCF